MCTEAHVLFCPALAAGYFTITTHLTNLVRSCGKFKLKAITFFPFLVLVFIPLSYISAFSFLWSPLICSVNLFLLLNLLFPTSNKSVGMVSWCESIILFLLCS